MTPLTGIVRNGKIEIAAPNGCGEGDQVNVWISTISSDNDLDEDSNPERVAERVKAMEEFESIQLTADEQELWENSIKEQRKLDMENFAQRSSKLESTFK